MPMAPLKREQQKQMEEQQRLEKEGPPASQTGNTIAANTAPIQIDVDGRNKVYGARVVH